MTTARRRFGRYDIRGTLGHGGFATVYRAWDPALEREVALKALHPHLGEDAGVRRRFVAEARALARLRHPNLVPVYDVGVADDRPFFTMPVLTGPTLDRLIQPGGLPSAQAFALLRGIAAAVDALHGERLLHRDIKPGNVVVEAGDQPVLMDLGIARSLDGAANTVAGTMMGTPAYMAPEQVRSGEIGPAADIYALAVMAYELLSGRPPFVGDTPTVLHAQVYEAPPSLDSTRQELSTSAHQALSRALAKDPALRPRTAGELVDELASQSIEGSSGATSSRNEMIAPSGRREPVPMARPAGADRMRRGWIPAAAAAGVLLVAAVAFGALSATGAFSSKAKPTSAPAAAQTATPAQVVIAAATPTATPLAIASTPFPGTTSATTGTPGRTSTPVPISTSPAGTYQVRSADTLIEIAKQFGVTLDALRAANAGITEATPLQIGQQLRIPTPNVTPTPASTLVGTPSPSNGTPVAIPTPNVQAFTSSGLANGPQPQIIAVVPLDPRAVAGHTFRFSVTTHNQGQPASAGDIIVNSLGVNSLSAKLDGCGEGDKGADGKATAVPAGQYSFAQAHLLAWPTNSTCTLVATADIPSEAPTVTFLLRTNATLGEKQVEWPRTTDTGISLDSQARPAITWIVPVQPR